MKNQIVGYITGVINSYSRTIDRLNASGAPITSTNSFQAFKEEFNDLLEFVIDIPEENKEAIFSFNVALQNENLKKRIIELEERCEDMCEIEKNLHKKIENLEIALTLSKGIMDPIFKENLKKAFKAIR